MIIVMKAGASPEQVRQVGEILLASVDPGLEVGEIESSSVELTGDLFEFSSLLREFRLEVLHRLGRREIPQLPRVLGNGL